MLHHAILILITWVSIPIEAAIFSLDQMEKLGCTYKNISSDLDKDIVIGALFPIHHYLIKRYTINVNSIAWVESFLFAIHQINQNAKLLPNVSLGYVVKDTCNDEELALRQALSFMVDMEYFRKMSDVRCNLPFKNESVCQCSQNMRRKIAASIGCDLSTVSHHVSMLTSTDYLPQISPFSVNPELSKIRNFLRTLPSDIYQTTAIVDLIQHFNWSYVSVLASDNDYGRFAKNNLVGKMKDRGMCTGVEKIFDPHFPSNDMEKLINDIRVISSKSNVIVLWCDVNEAIHIINETHNAGLKNITWIGAEIWGTHRDLRKLSVKIPDMRLISLSMESQVVPAFEKHFNEIDYNSKLNNPWFADLWHQLNRCPPKKKKHFFCLPDYPKTRDITTLQHENVMYAVYAIAYGLHSYLNCTKVVCYNKDAPINYRRLLQHIKNATFRIPTSNAVFKFNDKGEKTFTSYTYKVRKFNTPNARGKWIKRLEFEDLGRWNGTTKSSTINMKILNKTWSYKPLPIATCSQPCKPGTFKVNGSTTCCWKCPLCAENEISTTYNQQKCRVCQSLETSNYDHTACIPLEDQRLTIYTISGQLLTSFSLLGIIILLWVISVYRQHWDTPVVKSSSREISVIQLTLMLILFFFPILDMLEVSKPICILKTSIFGILYSQVIAFIVIKTYRLYCVFNTQFTQISKLLKNEYQIFFSFILVLPQIILIIVWYNVFELKIEVTTFPSRKSLVYHCGTHEDKLIYAMTGYIVLLSLVGGFMAFRARKLPENYKETLTIFYAMFTNIFLWLPVFFLCYMLSPQRDNQIIVFITINMAGNFSLLVVLYGSKMIIILLYPELNSKEHFRQMAASNTMLTFLKDVDPKTFGQKRVSQQAVLEIDFDAMFKEYKDKQHESLPQPPKITLSNTIKRIDRHMTFKRRNSSVPKSKVSPLRERKYGSTLANLESVNSTAMHEETSSNENSEEEKNIDDGELNDRRNKLERLDSLKLNQLSKSPSYSINENIKSQYYSIGENKDGSSPTSPSYQDDNIKLSPATKHRIPPPSPLCRNDSSNPSSPSFTIGRNVVIHNVVKSPSNSNSSQTLDVPPPPTSYEESNLSRDNSIISLIRKEQKNLNRPAPKNVFEFPDIIDDERKNTTTVTSL